MVSIRIETSPTITADKWKKCHQLQGLFVFRNLLSFRIQYVLKEGFFFLITVWLKTKQQKIPGHQYTRCCSSLLGNKSPCTTGLLSLMLIWQKDPSLSALNVKCWYLSFLSQSIQVEPNTDTHVCVNCSLFCFLE